MRDDEQINTILILREEAIRETPWDFLHCLHFLILGRNFFVILIILFSYTHSYKYQQITAMTLRNEVYVITD